MIRDEATHSALAGPFDIAMILYNIETKRYHVCVLEESPMPGALAKADVGNDVIRLRSKMHHTTGSETLEGAAVHLKELVLTDADAPAEAKRSKLVMPESNIVRDRAYP